MRTNLLTVGVVVALGLFVALIVTVKLSGWRLHREQTVSAQATDKASSATLTVEGTEQLAGAAADLSMATDRLRRTAATLDQQAAHDPSAQDTLPADVLSRHRIADSELCAASNSRSLDCS